MSTRLPVAERRSHLVDAALEVAAEEGIAATTVRRVADRAGVALGVVHYCFADKDELFAALASRIVDDLAGAGRGAVDAVPDRAASAPTLSDALDAAVAGLWATVEQSAGEQLLTYEITTHALRTPGLQTVAERQYAVSQAAAEHLLTLCAAAAGATWTQPVAELAGEALAVLDGVTLRWLVDRDTPAARARLASFTGYLATRAAS